MYARRVLLLVWRALLATVRSSPPPSSASSQARIKSSEVLAAHLQATNASYTSFYIPLLTAENDLFGRSYLRFAVRPNTTSTASANSSTQWLYYDVYRTGCLPMVKFFCNRVVNHQAAAASHRIATSAALYDGSEGHEVFDRSARLEDKLLLAIKLVNCGVPTLLYGMASLFLLRSSSIVSTSRGNVEVFYLYGDQPRQQSGAS